MVARVVLKKENTFFDIARKKGNFYGTRTNGRGTDRAR